MASAVPQEPAPMTVIGSVRRYCIGDSYLATGSGLVDQTLLLLRHLRRLRKQGVEVDQGEEKIREAALHDQIRNHLARVRKQDARAKAADQTLQILHRRAGDREHTRLLHFDQVQRRLSLLRLERDGQQHFADVGRKLLGGGIHVELKFRLPCLIVRQPRTVRRLIRAILQVNALQAHLHAADVGLWPRSSNLVHQAPWIKRSSSPLRSSSNKSSQPPMCLSPMKICGTVRRLLRANISSRNLGSSSTLISLNTTFF